MDNVQTLIAKGKLVTVSELDANETYVEVGVYQEGNRKIGPANADAYPSYVVSLLDLLNSAGGGGGGTPSGPAGGSLTGTYPNPGVNWLGGLSTYNAQYYPLSSNPAGYLTAITSSQITTALGYTPYSNSNPAGYITVSSLSPYLTSATAAATYQPIGAYLTSIFGLAISQLNNDSGYITSSALSPYITAAAAATTYYPLTNPSGYITSAALAGYLTSAAAASTYQPIGSYLTAVSTDSTLTGNGTPGSPLSVVSGGGGAGSTVVLKKTIDLNNGAVQSLSYPAVGKYIIEDVVATNASTNFNLLATSNIGLFVYGVPIVFGLGGYFASYDSGSSTEYLKYLFNAQNYIKIPANTDAPICFPPPCNGLYVGDASTSYNPMQFQVSNPVGTAATVDLYIKLLRLE